MTFNRKGMLVHSTGMLSRHRMTFLEPYPDNLGTLSAYCQASKKGCVFWPDTSVATSIQSFDEALPNLCFVIR